MCHIFIIGTQGIVNPKKDFSQILISKLDYMFWIAIKANFYSINVAISLKKDKKIELKYFKKLKNLFENKSAI